MTAFILLSVLATSGPAPVPAGYEEQLIAWAVKDLDREREPAPEGKVVEEVLVASEEVFAPSDPYPSLLNVFHAKTKATIVRNEVRLEVGQPWTPERVMETERNLRRIFILAVAKVVALKGRAGGVALLVVTKDRWSLRLNSEFTLIGPLLQYLRLRPTEMNFRGWNQQLALDFILRLDTVTLGQSFIERRLWGTRLYLGESAGLIFNRATGALEGTSGVVVFGQPLITLDQRWAFLTEAQWNFRRRRVFRGTSVWQLPYPDEDGEGRVPFIYDVRELSAEASVTRSLGSEVKLDLTAAAGAYSRRYAPPGASGLTGDQVDWMRLRYLPRSENALYAHGFARAFRADFRVLRNLDSFELSEDFQLGPLAQAGVRWAIPSGITTAPFVELGGAFRYRWYRFDDLLTVSLAGAARLRPSQSPVNQRVAAEIINYSPLVYGGRFVTRLMVDVKLNDLDNRQLLLGGSSGLRGTYPEQLSGRNVVLGNFEYRARPMELFTNQVGLAFFYDVGSAFDAQPVLTHSTGVGLRILLPQFNQEVIRIDLGVVIGGPVPGLDRLNASFGQVTDARPGFLDHPI